MIAAEATRCKNIVRGLLDFARRSRVSKTPTDLARLLDDVLLIMNPAAEAAKVRLSCAVPDGLPTMLIDSVQIKQLLVNLVQNGVDAIRGPGEIAIEAAPRDGNAVTITVRDTGRGIAPEHLSKIFEPFFTTKEMGKGTGLGLAIAYGVVKMHSGDITVESEPGKGTTFRVTLPIGSQEAQ